MNDKLQNLSQLNELLKSGAITNAEFESLKKGILNDAPINSPNDNNLIRNAIKIDLRGFHGNEGKFIKPPEIESLDIQNMNSNEIGLLRPFLKQKQIYAPASMTQDEIKIGKKIFTANEIDKINSEREGFNYPFLSIFSVLCGAATIFAIKISPCFIYLGAGTGGLANLVISFMIFGKNDSTKLDKTFCVIGIIEIVIALVMFNEKWPF